MSKIPHRVATCLLFVGIAGAIGCAAVGWIVAAKFCACIAGVTWLVGMFWMSWEQA